MPAPSFFHIYDSGRRRKNFIAHLKVHNVIVSKHEDNALAVDDFFENILGSVSERGYSLDLDFLRLPSHDLAALEGEFTEQEVWKVTRELELDKAPGPDGFTRRFYLSC